MSKQFEIKDSGERRDFDTGAKRDVDYDKPRFDLIPITVLREFIKFSSNRTLISTVLGGISDETKAQMWSLGMMWGDTANNNFLLELIWICLDIIQQQEEDSFLDVESDKYSGFHIISPRTYCRLANHYGGGAKKYDPWNWSKGMPLSVFHASLMRHIFDIIENKTDEDHLSAIFFNAAAIIHFNIIGREDTDDITPRLVEWGIHADSKV